MDKKTIYWLLTLVFIISLGLRLFLAYQTPYFSTDSAYYHLRQIEHIRETGLPIIFDPLSYGGRTHIYLPLFDYIMVFFSLFFPLSIVAKVLPNIFASTIVFVMFLLVNHTTKNKEVALLCASLSAIIPIFFGKTLNSLSVYSLSIPLFFLILYYFLKSQEEPSVWMYIVLFSFAMLLHSSCLIIVLGLLVYLILLKIERISITKSELEVFLFSLFLLLWFYILVFKRALLMHGFDLLWRNMPTQILINFFYEISIIQAAYLVGLVPLICGAYVIYFYIFKTGPKYINKSRNLYLFISFCLLITSLLWMKLIEISVGLMYISLLFVVLFSEAYIIFENYISKTKISSIKPFLFTIILTIVTLSLLFPAVAYALEIISTAPSEDEIGAIIFLNEIVAEDNENTLIVGDVTEGNIITYFTNFSTIADTDFILRDDVNERLRDVSIIYSTYSRIMASRIMDKYSADYIFLSKETMVDYNITSLPVEDNNCFRLIYTADETKIYEYGCKYE